MVNIVRISAAEFSKEASHYQDVALSQPVSFLKPEPDLVIR